jgi:glutamate synthase (NADPH/NADH) small chain
MGDPKGFLKVSRGKPVERPVDERLQHYGEFTEPAAPEELRAQASRCMDCGIPFCHQGCPLGNLIPEWNDLVYRGRLDEAVLRLEETNNFPEVTGRVCPAPCEASCVLNIDDNPVTIKVVEKSIADHALAAGTLVPRRPSVRLGQRVAVVGSGPAGLAAAQQLARAGYEVTVLEKDDRLGGLLRYGIPDFKMEKHLIDRRLDQMKAEGVLFRTQVDVGVDVTGEELRARYDAVILAGGARRPRDLPITGRALGGVHFAMDFLTQQNRRVAGDVVPAEGAILAGGKNVVVIGGGDTGSDCVGTSLRQGASSVVQLELMPKPGLVRMPTNPWPAWPLVLRTSSSHAEGAKVLTRDWAVMTRAFHAPTGDGGGGDTKVGRLEAVRVELSGGQVRELPGTPFDIPCDLALLAMGFTGPEPGTLIGQLGVALDARGNVAIGPDGATSVAGVFAAGDMSRGQSLVVWAIADGRRAAATVDRYLRATQAVSLSA